MSLRASVAFLAIPVGVFGRPVESQGVAIVDILDDVSDGLAREGLREVDVTDLTQGRLIDDRAGRVVARGDVEGHLGRQFVGLQGLGGPNGHRHDVVVLIVLAVPAIDVGWGVT